MSEQLTQPVLVSADLSSVDPTQLVGEELVKWVQYRLLELGYTDGGPADGSMNLKTQGTILDFRNRNGLALIPDVDVALISMLIKGPSIELPVTQVTAQTPQIAEKVEAVKQTWWARFYAKVLLIPSGIMTIILGIVNNFGDAVALLTPVKSFITENLSTLSPITTIIIITTLTTIISFILWRNTAKAETALVDGFRAGTVKNDVEAAKGGGA